MSVADLIQDKVNRLSGPTQLEVLDFVDYLLHKQAGGCAVVQAVSDLGTEGAGR